jgi:hypothetical protein
MNPVTPTIETPAVRNCTVQMAEESIVLMII